MLHIFSQIRPVFQLIRVESYYSSTIGISLDKHLIIKLSESSLNFNLYLRGIL